MKTSFHFFLTTFMICLFGNLHSQTLELTINISYPDAEMGLEDGVSEVCIVSNPAFISTAWGDGCLPILPVSEMSTTAVLPDFPEYNLTFIYYCDGDTVIIPVQLIEANLLNLSCEIEISCGSSGPTDWDCPDLIANIGASCQGGWGVVDENCDCVQVEMDCLGAAGLDITLLMAYFSNECANQNNIDSWWYCGLIETLVAAEMGDGEACATIVEWVAANNWTDALDCPELGGNIGDYCINLDGTLGEITEGCVCVEDTTWCDLEVITNLLSNDDGSGNGSVEAVVEGGEAPYTYIWESWNGGVIGTEAILNNCVAGSYFVQVTDYDGCVAFGGEDVGLSVDTLEWDCLNLNMNIGDPCQSGWGVIDENCDCVEDLFSEGCLAGFSVVQAYEDNNVIPFELFVYLENYDESNDYYWSFGDEGSSTDPFPTWIYETNGPYVLCLTVSNEADSCSTTYCQNIAIDSLGWVDGLQDGFTINVLNGNENSTIGIEVAPEDLFSFSVFPNPIIGSELHVHWVSRALNNVESTIMSLEGKIVARHTSANSSTGSSMTINVDQLSPGMYILQVRQGFRTQSKTVVIR